MRCDPAPSTWTPGVWRRQHRDNGGAARLPACRTKRTPSILTPRIFFPLDSVCPPSALSPHTIWHSAPNSSPRSRGSADGLPTPIAGLVCTAHWLCTIGSNPVFFGRSLGSILLRGTCTLVNTAFDSQVGEASTSHGVA